MLWRAQGSWPRGCWHAACDRLLPAHMCRGARRVCGLLAPGAHRPTPPTVPQVVDLISLKPFDMETISKSIKKTRRVGALVMPRVLPGQGSAAHVCAAAALRSGRASRAFPGELRAAAGVCRAGVGVLCPPSQPPISNILPASALPAAQPSLLRRGLLVLPASLPSHAVCPPRRLLPPRPSLLRSA